MLLDLRAPPTKYIEQYGSYPRDFQNSIRKFGTKNKSLEIWRKSEVSLMVDELIKYFFEKMESII